MIYAFPFVFVGLHLLLVSMLVELSYDFKGQGDYQGVCHLADLGMSTSFQVDLLFQSISFGLIVGL
jgi:hypothetical protein